MSDIYYNAVTHKHVVKREIVDIYKVDGSNDPFMRLHDIYESKDRALNETYHGRVYWKENNIVYSGILQQPWQYKPVIDGECITDWGINWGNMYATSMEALIDGVMKAYPTSEYVTEYSIKRNAQRTNTGLYYVHIHYDGRM